MLSPEQTRLRIQDRELSELRKEKDRLEIKVRDMRVALKEVILHISNLSGFPYQHKAKLRELADTIDV